MSAVDNVKLVVVVDYIGREDLKLDVDGVRHPGEVGLSIYVEIGYGEETHHILFDTGGSSENLFFNSKRLGIDLMKIEKVVISHWHIDHTGGLVELMKLNKDLEVYGPPMGTGLSPLDMFIKFKVPRKPHVVKASTEILPGVAVVGPLKGFFPFPPFKVGEDALAIKLKDNSLVVLVGCSHPKTYSLVDEALSFFNSGKVKLLIGGFHLIFPTSKRGAIKILEELKNRPIDKIAPIHCSGDRG